MKKINLFILLTTLASLFLSCKKEKDAQFIVRMHNPVKLVPRVAGAQSPNYELRATVFMSASMRVDSMIFKLTQKDPVYGYIIHTDRFKGLMTDRGGSGNYLCQVFLSEQYLYEIKAEVYVNNVVKTDSIIFIPGLTDISVQDSTDIIFSNVVVSSPSVGMLEFSANVSNPRRLYVEEYGIYYEVVNNPGINSMIPIGTINARKQIFVVSGRVNVSPGDLISVEIYVKANGFVYFSKHKIIRADGGVGTPSYTFRGDTLSGYFYYPHNKIYIFSGKIINTTAAPYDNIDISEYGVVITDISTSLNMYATLGTNTTAGTIDLTPGLYDISSPLSSGRTYKIDYYVKINPSDPEIIIPSPNNLTLTFL
ncbi:MAG: hypothetical protein NZ529_10575 [Cytophagaceae bacterium]|nr:hypothetical protein [Cytophagaceae bacterium]MDW8457231.1 hypothetical protein [Cytophagaceae bacterium]